MIRRILSRTSIRIRLLAMVSAFIAGNSPATAQTGLRPVRVALRPAAPVAKAENGIKRVLALRVQFRKEDPDRGITTGNGHFDLGANVDGRIIDPPPHNKAYFEDQLLAMRNYFFDVSDGRLDIQYTVKPDGDTSAYTLTRFMEYYGIRGTQAARDKRLAEFFYDAVALADTSGGIDFSQYDHVIIFHAGAGEDFAADNQTTNDLSSRFISLDLLKSQFGPAFQGVPVQSGTRFVPGGVIVPETETQAFTDPVLGIEFTRQLGLTGILVANYGSQLGMPDLFNTSTGGPAIGVFGLEDFGAVNGDGLMPAEPDPWTKIFMGWANPIVVSDTLMTLLPRKQSGENTIVKIPINSTEYFLVENKQRNVIPNALGSETVSRFDTINLSDGSVIVDTVYFAGVERSLQTGVITSVDEFDNALPGNGLLIWHIDEKIIADKMAVNTINADLDRRGVRLVEASGSQDIGRAFSGFFGVTLGSGDRFDYFYHGNEAFMFYNNDADSIFFTPTSVPSSLSNERANTGIRLTRIGSQGTSMIFTLETTLSKPGFPQFIGTEPVADGLKFSDIDGDGKDEVVVLSTDGEVFAWRHDGTKVIPNSIHRTHVGLGLDTMPLPVALFAETSELALFPPAVADLDNDLKAEIIVVTLPGRISVYSSQDLNFDGRADTVFTRTIPGTATCAPLVLPDRRLAVGNSDGLLSVINPNGSLHGSVEIGARIDALALLNDDSLLVQTPVSVTVVRWGDLQFFSAFSSPTSGLGASVADLNQDGEEDILIVNDDGYPVIFTDGDALPATMPYAVFGHPAVADLDNDGYLEMAAGGDNSIVVMNHNGSSTTNFPVILDQASYRGKITTAVIVGDVSGDGKPDVVAGTADGMVYAYSGAGERIDGFPLATGKEIRGLAIADLDDDGITEIAAVTIDGFLYVFDINIPFVSSSMLWPQVFRDGKNSSNSPESHTITPTAGDVLPSRRAYNYPNPARGDRTTIRYFLTENAQVRVFIYDLAGDLVEKLEGPGLGQTDNEVSWDLKKIQSGVYIAQVIAKGVSGKKSVRTIKIAVTK